MIIISKKYRILYHIYIDMQYNLAPEQYIVIAKISILMQYFWAGWVKLISMIHIYCDIFQSTLYHLNSCKSSTFGKILQYILLIYIYIISKNIAISI